MDYNTVFLTAAPFILAINFSTEWLKGVSNLKPEDGISQYLSWAIGITLSLFAMLFNLGMFSEFSLIQTLIVGFASALASNGLYDAGFVTWVISLFSKTPDTEN